MENADVTKRHEIKVTITEYDIACVLCSACEGGSNYWARFSGAPYDIDFSKDKPKPLCLPVLVHDLEESGYTTHILSMESVERGIALLPEHPRHFADILMDNADAGTGDVFLQLCIFGELVYG